MSDLGWRAEGIERAEKVGGVTLERYTRPGYVSAVGVRRAERGSHAEGFDAGFDPEPPSDERDRLLR